MTTPAHNERATRLPAEGRLPAPHRDTPGVRVVCVDDHAVLVEGLRAQFDIEGRIEIVASLRSADGLLQIVAETRADVVLLDIEMPGADAFESADRLLHLRPDVRVIFLSAHIRDAFISAAYTCGASGYFTKADEPEEIAAGILQAVHAPKGTFVMGPKVRAHCRPTPSGPSPHRRSADPDEDRPRTSLDRLTVRELEVVRLIGKGLSRSEIAAELCRSAKTIDGHQERILRKLGLASRAELMRLAIREGLAEA